MHGPFVPPWSLDPRADWSTPPPQYEVVSYEPLKLPTTKIFYMDSLDYLKPKKGFVWWLTGLSGSGKSTIANAIEKAIRSMALQVCRIDGDLLRRGLSSDLGFSDQDRAENVRRAAEIAKMMSDAGIHVCVSMISPSETARSRAEEIIGPGRFGLVYVNTPLEVCEKRDPKGLYAKARAGEIQDFTGISHPYEEPSRSRWTVTGHDCNPDDVAELVISEILYHKPM